MNYSRYIARFGVSALSAGLAAVLLTVALGIHPTEAALIEGGKGPQLLIGLDDDRQDNTAIQAGAGANQSLNRTDILEGGQGNDVMFGLNGNDVMDGGQGRDIILGGPDGGAAPGGPPNSDIMFGGPGDDVNLWAPGDGSEAFIGGPGVDAIIFGATDRDASSRSNDRGSAADAALRRSRVPAGYTDGERERSDKFLHGRGEPVARIRLPDSVPQRRWCHRRDGPREGRRAGVLQPGRRDLGSRSDAVNSSVRRHFTRGGSSAQRAGRSNDPVAIGAVGRHRLDRVNSKFQTPNFKATQLPRAKSPWSLRFGVWCYRLSVSGGITNCARSSGIRTMPGAQRKRAVGSNPPPVSSVCRLALRTRTEHRGGRSADSGTVRPGHSGDPGWRSWASPR